jgi:hypothetical protein
MMERSTDFHLRSATRRKGCDGPHRMAHWGSAAIHSNPAPYAEPRPKRLLAACGVSGNQIVER